VHALRPVIRRIAWVVFWTGTAALALLCLAALAIPLSSLSLAVAQALPPSRSVPGLSTWLVGLLWGAAVWSATSALIGVLVRHRPRQAQRWRAAAHVCYWCTVAVSGVMLVCAGGVYLWGAGAVAVLLAVRVAAACRHAAPRSAAAARVCWWCALPFVVAPLLLTAGLLTFSVLFLLAAFAGG
jgi:hypothetical protein